MPGHITSLSFALLVMARNFLIVHMSGAQKSHKMSNAQRSYTESGLMVAPRTKYHDPRLLSEPLGWSPASTKGITKSCWEQVPILWESYRLTFPCANRLRGVLRAPPLWSKDKDRQIGHPVSHHCKRYQKLGSVAIQG